MTDYKFLNGDEQIGTLGPVAEFWRWAMSDLLGNTNRGLLAEYIVGKALGEDALSRPRVEWDCYDLIYRECFRIEVKSSAYVQSWHTDKDKKSTLSFGVAPHTCWDARNNTQSNEKKRHAHLYVFCVFPAERDVNIGDVLDINQWRFYVTTTQKLEDKEKGISAETKQIGITKVRQICGAAIGFEQLKPKIDSLCDSIECKP